LYIEYEITQTFGTHSLALIATIKGASAVALLVLQIRPTAKQTHIGREMGKNP